MEAKVSWISRNPVLPDEMSELRAKLGQCSILQHQQTFVDAKQIVAWVREDTAKHAVIVAPLSVISHVIMEGPEIIWLYAEMMPFHDECRGRGCEKYDAARDVIITQRGISRHHRFNGFKRIVEIKMILEPF